VRQLADYPAARGNFPGRAAPVDGGAGAAAGTASALNHGMAVFLKRFIGVLALDVNTFEEIEADRRAAMQSVVVILLVGTAGGFAALGLDAVTASAFTAGALVSLGAWLVWAVSITTLGTVAFPEARTKSDLREVLSVLGFAAAPGVFIAFAAMRAIAAPALALVVGWTIAAAVVGVRQALDFGSTSRAIAVCAAAWLLSLGVVWSALMMFSVTVS
jgi:hypothetical protein